MSRSTVPSSPMPPIGRRPFLALMGSSLLLPASGLAQPAPAIKRGGTLIMAIDDNPPYLVTAIGTGILAIATSGQLFDTLIKIDRDFHLQPSLAHAWEQSADGLSVTFHLEPNVVWHDGTPFTSEDVRYSFLEINRKYNSLAAQSYKDVASIETPDKDTAIFRLTTPDPAFFPWAFSQPNFAQVFPKHIYEGTDPRNNPMNYKPIGTGPFMFREWVRGSRIVMERNPKYFHPDRIYLDRIVFQIIPEPSARQLALERGEIDHIPYFALAPASVEPLAHSKNTAVIDSLRPALGEIIMFMNLRHPQLGVREVRQAIAHAIDRELVIKLALNGHGKVPTGPIRSDNPPFYTADVALYPYDPARAKQLLDQAGLKPGAGGMRLALRLSYEAAAEGGAEQAAAEIMREHLKAVGIDLQLMPMDPASWQQSAFIDWNFDLTMSSFGTGPDPKIAVTRIYTTENIKRLFSANVMGYSNKAVDELMKQADAEMESEQRAKLYHQAQALIVADLPALWLWEKYYPIAIRKGLAGLPSGSMHSEVFEGVGWTV
jgi:peptide/nickel transport system substrate-binding protein